jgi:hypothetical protein
VLQGKCVARHFINPEIQMQMKLFCALILLSMVSFRAMTSPLKTNKSFSVQNNFSDSLNGDKVIVEYKVRLRPNPSPTGTIVINSTSNVPLHFYVFDLEGTLLHRLILKPKEQRTITDLEKGIYTYDVFKNDESIEQGKIIVTKTLPIRGQGA